MRNIYARRSRAKMKVNHCAVELERSRRFHGITGRRDSSRDREAFGAQSTSNRGPRETVVFYKEYANRCHGNQYRRDWCINSLVGFTRYRPDGIPLRVMRSSRRDLAKDGCPACPMCPDSQRCRCESIRDSHLQLESTTTTEPCRQSANSALGKPR